MNISTEIKEDILLIKIEGRLDARGSQQLQETWSKSQNSNIIAVILDMSRTDYLSSVGLRVMLVIYKAMKTRGGALSVSGLQSYCRDVLDMAGFSDSFPLFNTSAEAYAACRDVKRKSDIIKNWDKLETVDTDCGSFKFIPSSNDNGVIHILGDVKNVLYSRITVSDLCSKRFSETEYSIGLGGLGDRVDDYFPIMGEMITIAGAMVWLPTDGNDIPDFLIPKSDKGKVTLRTGFNVSIGGRFNEIIAFKSKDSEGATMNKLYRGIFDTAKKRRKDFKGALGLAIFADLSKALGSGILKSPTIDVAPANGEMIVHPSNFNDWFESDTTPRHRDVTALICGIGVDLTSDLSAYDKELFNLVFYLHPSNVGGKTELLHNHAVIFKKVDMPKRTADLEEEIKKTVDEGEFLDMRHLIDSSSITEGFIGVSYIQNFHLDPSGVRGI